MITTAVLFLVVLFLVKRTSLFENKEIYQSNNSPEKGLVYDTITFQDLVNKDTDGDGVLDWEENLYGLDPTKKETTPGIPDSEAIQKLKEQNGDSTTTKGNTNQDEKSLTETEKFSRELFATVATASQNGTMDQAAVEKLSSSLAEKVQNSPPRKVFTIADMKITDDNSVQAFKNYNNALNSIYKKTPTISYTIMDVLQEFMPDENTVNTNALLKLNPIEKQTSDIMNALIKTNVPQSILNLHLNLINSLESLAENLSDIQHYEKDAILALGGISKYGESSTKLESDLNNLANAINQKLYQQ